MRETFRIIRSQSGCAKFVALQTMEDYLKQSKAYYIHSFPLIQLHHVISHVLDRVLSQHKLALTYFEKHQRFLLPRWYFAQHISIVRYWQMVVLWEFSASLWFCPFFPTRFPNYQLLRR